MTTLEKTLRRALRRHRGSRALRGAAAGLAAAAAAGVLLLAADRGLGLELAAPLYAALGLAGGIAGAAAALARTPGRGQMAVMLDRRYHLEDRLGTAAALEAWPGRPAALDPGFAALVQRDADRWAGRLDLRSATPLAAGPRWTAAALLWGALALAGFLLPAGPWTGPRHPVAPAQEEEAARRDRETVAETIEKAVAELREMPALGEAAGEEADALTALAEQLRREGGQGARPDPAGAREASAARLSELADRLARQADRDAAAGEELARRFEGIDAAHDEARGAKPILSRDELLDALRRGAFGEAGDLLEKLTGQASSMERDERRAAADRLRDLRRQALDAARKDPEEQDRTRRQLERALREQGIDPALRERLLGPEPRAGQALREAGMDEESAEDLARRLEALRRREAVDEQVERDARDLAGALDDAARAIDPEPEPPPAPGAENPPRQPPEPGSTPEGAGQGEGQKQRPGAAQESARGREQGQGQGRKDGAQPGQREGQRREGAEARELPREAGGERPVPGHAPTATEDRGEAAAPDGRERRAFKEPAPGPGAQPSPPDQPSPRAEGPPAASPGPGKEKPGAGPARPGGRRSPGKVLRELARRRQTARSRRGAAERALEMARQLAENMSPEERRRWAERWQRDLGGGGAAGDQPSSNPPRPGAAPFRPETEVPVNLAGEERGGRTVAEWLGEEPPLEGPISAGSPGELARRLHRARREAERAVEEASVPARYHRFIRRYFNRLEKSTGGPGPKPAGGRQSDPSTPPPPPPPPPPA